MLTLIIETIQDNPHFLFGPAKTGVLNAVPGHDPL